MQKISEESALLINDLRIEFDKKLNSIVIEEAKKNNPFKIGDIIKDHYQTGRIIDFKIRSYGNGYEIVYACERLTQKLKPYKSGENAIIYLCNIENAMKR